LRWPSDFAEILNLNGADIGQYVVFCVGNLLMFWVPFRREARAIMAFDKIGSLPGCEALVI